MTTPVISRVDLDADPVETRHGARSTVPRPSGERYWRRYDGTDAPAAASELDGPPGNGDLDRTEQAHSEQSLARVLGW